MATDASKVDVAVTGVVAFAPVGSEAPTDADGQLGVAWRDVGYISEDGVTEAPTRSVETIVAWQNADVVRSVVTESSMTISFTMIETNENSVELFYGAAVGVDGSVEINPGQTSRIALVVDYVDGDKAVRLYIPEAEVTELGEVTLASGSPVGYNVTVTGYPSADAGFTGKKWFSALAGS
jgi:hypothetical protein